MRTTQWEQAKGIYSGLALARESATIIPVEETQRQVEEGVWIEAVSLGKPN
jgi:hypothetical protein